jgi:uncharacterized protein YbjT (DUF2867 family)
LSRGDEIVAYVRRARGIAAEAGLQVHVGELSDALSLENAISGADAVLVCLGTLRKKPIDLMQKSVPPIIRAMRQVNVPRLVLLSAYGVAETALTAGFLARILYKTMVRSVYRDKEVSETMLPNSGLKWTSVYPVGLTDGPLVETVEVRPMTTVRKVSGLPVISRANVALVMLDAARDEHTIGQKLLVTSNGSVR